MCSDVLILCRKPACSSGRISSEFYWTLFKSTLTIDCVARITDKAKDSVFFHIFGFPFIRSGIIKNQIQSSYHWFVLHMLWQIVVMQISDFGPPYFKTYEGLLSIPDGFPVVSVRIASLNSCCNTSIYPKFSVFMCGHVCYGIVRCDWQLYISSQYFAHLLVTADVSVSNGPLLTSITCILGCCDFVKLFSVSHSVLLLTFDNEELMI